MYDINESIKNNDIQKPVVLSQWDVTGQLKKEIENLRYYYQRQADFWEWLENKKGLVNKELFNEFEEWEKTQS